MMLKTIFLAILVMAGVISDITAEKKIVCYYGSWAAYRNGLGKFDVSDINPALCTHIIYTFIGITTTGDVQVLDSWLDLPNGKDGYGRFTKLRQQSPGTKAMIAMGGWNEGSIKYSEVAAKPDIRARFVQNIVNFLKKYNFDGFDFDWEYPNQRGGKPADRENFVALLRELRKEFDKHGYILSVAVGSAESSASKSYIISQVSQYVHFINLMTYDFNGSWKNVAAINAPLYPSSNESGEQAKLNVNSAVRYWLSQGAPADKLIVGIPAYGRSFTLANSANNKVGAPTVSGGKAGPYTQETGTLGYNEICEYLAQGWTIVREREQFVPYAFSGNQWVGYDDTTSVQEKANYVKSMGLGGMMMWSVDTDDFRGNCGEKYPLLSTINRVLRGNVPSPVPTHPSEPDVPGTGTPPKEPTPSPPSPPDNSVCTHEGYVRDPKDCSIFYYCRKLGGKYEISTFHCPAGLVFDLLFNGCNYKQNVAGC
ncbi:chitinase-3-like protein 1 isoform X1 [Xylocopa sonorina]|uniref:chitinase-3-like protein 1 isoform X1 n=1 Tax=Xylocopa sonorina TaxID=1818115 RepID=UPI00403B28C5